MANREKGEVSVEINGTSYTLCLDMDAMCRLEEMFSTPGHDVYFQDVLEKVNKGSQRHTRAVFWAAFQKYHKGIDLHQVSELVQGAGGIVGFSAQLLGKMGMAVEATTADPKDLEAMGIDPTAHPQKAQARRRAAGTGRRSTARRGRSH